MCHQRVTGGDGWNPYGWRVRELYVQFGRQSITDAFALAESANSDQDELELSNIQEIDKGLFPGWVNSDTNLVIFKDLTFLANQSPPQFEQEDSLDNEEQEFCFPIVNSWGSVTLVCL